LNTLNSKLIRGTKTLNHFILKGALITMSLAVLSNTALAKTVSHTLVLQKKYQTASMKSALPRNWTGIYGGLNVGGIFNHNNLNSNHLAFVGIPGVCNTTSNFSSIFPGAQVGLAHQFNSNIVLGVEGDFTYDINNQSNTGCVCQFHPVIADSFVINNREQGSLRARIGYALPHHLLPFFTAGGSIAKLGMSYNNANGDYYSVNTSQGGWLVGAGLELMGSHNWSIRAEYYYTNYGNALNMAIPTVYGLSDPNGGAHSKLSTNDVRLAINYWL